MFIIGRAFKGSEEVPTGFSEGGCVGSDHAWTHVCVYIYIYICTHVYIWYVYGIYIYIYYTYNMYVCVYVYIYIYILCIFMFVCMYIYIYKYLYIHIYVYTYSLSLSIYIYIYMYATKIILYVYLSTRVACVVGSGRLPPPLRQLGASPCSSLNPDEEVGALRQDNFSAFPIALVWYFHRRRARSGAAPSSLLCGDFNILSPIILSNKYGISSLWQYICSHSVLSKLSPLSDSVVAWPLLTWVRIFLGHLGRAAC